MCIYVYGGVSVSNWGQTRDQSPVSVVSATGARVDVGVQVSV